MTILSLSLLNSILISSSYLKTKQNVKDAISTRNYLMYVDAK